MILRWLVGILGALMLAVGIGVLGLIALTVASDLTPWQPLGSLWFAFDAGSLNAVQVLFERYLWAPLWSRIVLPFLTMQAPWAAAASLGVGIALSAAALVGMRKRSRHARAGDP